MKGFLKKGRSFKAKKKAAFALSPLHKQLLVGFFLMLITGLVLLFVWYVAHLPSLQIKEIRIVGGETIPHTLIQEKVNTALTGTYFALVPKRFALLYPKTAVVNNVRTVNRVKNVHVEEDDRVLTIVFDEHVPFALWCETQNATSCLFMDRAGYAFAPAPSLEGSAFIRYVADSSVPEVGTFGFESAFVKDTGTFITLLEENLGLYVTGVHKIGTFDVEYILSGGGVIKVSQSIPMQESFENLQTILLSDEFKHLEPGTFQYIDLRFGEKIFVNEESPSAQEDTTATTSNPL